MNFDCPKPTRMEKADDCKLDDSGRQGGGTENTFLRRKKNDNYIQDRVIHSLNGSSDILSIHLFALVLYYPFTNSILLLNKQFRTNIMKKKMHIRF